MQGGSEEAGNGIENAIEKKMVMRTVAEQSSLSLSLPAPSLLPTRGFMIARFQSVAIDVIPVARGRSALPRPHPGCTRLANGLPSFLEEQNRGRVVPLG